MKKRLAALTLCLVMLAGVFAPEYAMAAEQEGGGTPVSALTQENTPQNGGAPVPGQNPAPGSDESTAPSGEGGSPAPGSSPTPNASGTASVPGGAGSSSVPGSSPAPGGPNSTHTPESGGSPAPGQSPAPGSGSTPAPESTGAPAPENSESPAPGSGSMPMPGADGDQPGAEPGPAQNVAIIPALNGIGFPGVSYDLLAGVRVSPETDGEGDPILVRVKSVTSTEGGYQWDGSTMLTPPDGGNVVYTITYEAYVGETVYAAHEFVFTVKGDQDIGETLDGDYAYISDAGLLADDATESKLAIRTGTAPWDENDSAGNDTGALNNAVRSFDIVSYTAYFKSKVREGAPYAAYRTGTLHFEFVLPGTAEQARFETGSMGWLEAKKDVKYEITEQTHNGQACQVLRGSYLWEPSDQNPAAIGESYQELTLVVRALAMQNGESVKPSFTFWLEHNDVPADGLVTGSGYKCGTHEETEYKTITVPEIRVTAEPRYNVQLKTASTTEYLDTFDFATGNDFALNKGAGSFYGRANAVGVTLQIKGKSPQHGMRGCEMPDGSPITLNLTLSSSYRGTDGQAHNTADDYMPLVWSLEGNSMLTGVKQVDGRPINGPYTYAATSAPFNAYMSIRHNESCQNGGSWAGTQQSTTVGITISDYEIDLKQLPKADGGAGEVSTYYDPNAVSGYWDIQNACFSAGEIWVVQPFYDKEGVYIIDKHGPGTFTTTITDCELQVSSLSGQVLPEVEDNSNQMAKDDDTVVLAMYLERTGTMDQVINYVQYDTLGWDNSFSAGCDENGKDWGTSGAQISIQSFFSHISAEGQNVGVAYDDLIKFDDTFFKLDEVKKDTLAQGFDNLNARYLYGAKPDKTGWNHSGLKPSEAGYDSEMMRATADDLVFFSSLEELERQGYTCVAVLCEMRGLSSDRQMTYYWALNGSIRADASPNSVYMVTHSGKAWSKQDVQAAAAAYHNKDAAALTDEDYKAYAQSDAFPSRADSIDAPLNYEADYLPSVWTNDYHTRNGLRTYQKASYNENGYMDGSAGRLYGDSCLVVGYATEITKAPAQTANGYAKLAYDMDVNQRIADYVLHPTAVRSDGESLTENAEIVTDLYIEDTLPKGLAYIPNSSYWGGTYRQTGEGKQGVVEGGTPMEPEITVNADGTTTLRWTLAGVTVTKDEVTHFDPIYYSCDIGKPGDEENDVKNNDQLLNTAIIWSKGEQVRDFIDTNGNKADQSILISKNNAISLSKLADQIVVDVGDEMGFTMNVGNNSTNPLPVIALDGLPYMGDAAGSRFDGPCRVTELTVLSKELLEGSGGFKLYYTTAESERGKTSEDYDAADFADSSVWTPLAVDASTGSVALPDDFAPVGIAAVGSLPASQTLKMHVTLLLPEGKPGDYVANRLTRGDLESYARSYIVSRTLEGLVWNDSDRNGLRGSGETLVNGVTATLMQLTPGGDAADPAAYAPYQAGGKDASMLTGQQMDLSTGAVTTYGMGRYKFTNLPEGTFGVRFSDGTFVLGEYQATAQNTGSDETIDSDAAPAYGAGGALEKADISGIIMPAKEQISTMVYTSRYHDLGIHPAVYDLTVRKTVTGAMGDRDKLFSFTLELKDAEGQPVNGSFAYTGQSAVAGVAAPEAGVLTITEGTATFQLKHGQSITIEGLPRHTQYAVSEPGAEADGYRVTATGEVSTDMTADAEAAFTNDRQPVTPTGLLLNNWPMLALLVLAAGGGALLAVNGWRKLRRKQEND